MPLAFLGHLRIAHVPSKSRTVRTLALAAAALFSGDLRGDLVVE